MPVSGGVVEVVKMQIIDGKLIIGAKQRILKEMATKNPSDAVKALLAGESIHLQLLGLNHMLVCDTLAKQGIAT